MRRSIRVVVAIVLITAVAATTVWSSLALWYRLPAPELARAFAAGGFSVIGLSTIAALASRWRIRALLAFSVFFLLVLAWWNTIMPRATADWAPDVARQVTGTVEGNVLVLTNVRNFEWRSERDFREHWETRRYDLSMLRTVDVFMSHWSGPEIAHVVVSFGFQGGEYLAWSVEVRRLAGGAFSPLADLFKSNPLVIVAADERDVIGVRSNVRGEDVQVYRLKAAPDQARQLLLEYVSDANGLAKTPEFYNSLTSNCTTVVVKLMRLAGDTVPFDWRLIVNGYLPEYAYDRGALDTTMPMEALRDIAHIGERARRDGLSRDFSSAIRRGVPAPGLQSTP